MLSQVPGRVFTLTRYHSITDLSVLTACDSELTTKVGARHLEKWKRLVSLISEEVRMRYTLILILFVAGCASPNQRFNFPENATPLQKYAQCMRDTARGFLELENANRLPPEFLADNADIGCAFLHDEYRADLIDQYVGEALSNEIVEARDRAILHAAEMKRLIKENVAEMIMNSRN